MIALGRGTNEDCEGFSKGRDKNFVYERCAIVTLWLNIALAVFSHDGDV